MRVQQYNSVLKYIKISTLMVLLVMLLSACEKPTPSCYEAGDWGDTLDATVQVYAQDDDCIDQCPVHASCQSLNGTAYDMCVAECRRDDGVAPEPSCSQNEAGPVWTPTGLSADSGALPTVSVSGSVMVCAPNPLNVPTARGAVRDSGASGSNYFTYRPIYEDDYVVGNEPTSVGADAATSWVDGDYNPNNYWNPGLVIPSYIDNPLTLTGAAFGPKNAAEDEIPVLTISLREGERLVVEVKHDIYRSSATATHQNGENLFLSFVTADSTSYSYELDELNGDTAGVVVSRDGSSYTQHTIVAPEPIDVRLQYADTNNDITDNENGYELRIWTEGCYGENGKFLTAQIGSNNMDGDFSPQNFASWSAGQSGEIKFMVREPEDRDGNTDFHDNYGYYYVSVSVPDTSIEVMSNIANWLIDPIMELLYGETGGAVDADGNPTGGDRSGGVVQSIYNNIVTGEFRGVVRNSLILYIVLWGLGFIMGIIQASQYDVVLRIFKIGVISTLLSDTSWVFFSDYLFNVYIDGGMELVNLLSPEVINPASSDNPFYFMDQTLGKIFTEPMWYKILSLTMIGGIGILYAIMIIIGLVIVFVAFLKAILLYLMSIIAIALMLTMAPIFITFKLFSFTSRLFDGWISQLTFFMLQPVILFVTIMLFNEFIIIALHQVLSFGTCWDCVLNLDLSFTVGSVELGDQVCIMSFWLPWGHDSSGTENAETAGTMAYVTIFSIIIFIVIANATYAFIGWATSVAQVLTGEFQSNLADGMNALAKTTGLDRIENRVKAMPNKLGKALTAPARKAGRAAAAVGKGAAKDVARGVGAAAGVAAAAASATAGTVAGGIAAGAMQVGRGAAAATGHKDAAAKIHEKSKSVAGAGISGAKKSLEHSQQLMKQTSVGRHISQDQKDARSLAKHATQSDKAANTWDKHADRLEKEGDAVKAQEFRDMAKEARSEADVQRDLAREKSGGLVDKHREPEKKGFMRENLDQLKENPWDKVKHVALGSKSSSHSGFADYMKSKGTPTGGGGGSAPRAGYGTDGKPLPPPRSAPPPPPTPRKPTT